MIVVLVSVCLAAHPGFCSVERILTSYENIIACQLFSQYLVAEWKQEHRAYTVSRWSCDVLKPGQDA